MQRYHAPSSDPLPLVSPQREIDRARIAQATREFLARGGQIQQVGFQMSDQQPFVITGAKKRAELLAEQLARRLQVQAALGATPAAAAAALGITEKRARQLAQDYRIEFKHQR